MLIRIILLEFLFLKTCCNFTKGLATTISLTTRVLLVLFWNVFVLVELEFCAILAMFPISNSCQMVKHENCRVCYQRAFKSSLRHRTSVEIRECQSQTFATATKQSRHLIRMKIINQQPALLKAHCLEKFVRPKKQTEEVCFRSLMIPTDTVVQGFSRENNHRPAPIRAGAVLHSSDCILVKKFAFCRSNQVG